MTRPLKLTESERHAILWAVTASRAVIDRASRAGRQDVTAVAGEAPTVADLHASLSADVLHEADIAPVLAALRFAARLYGSGMEDLRGALAPPPLMDLNSARDKLEGWSAGLGKARQQA